MQKSPFWHHRTTLSGYILVNFGQLTAEIYWRVWGTPANFNGFRVLEALLHGTVSYFILAALAFIPSLPSSSPIIINNLIQNFQVPVTIIFWTAHFFSHFDYAVYRLKSVLDVLPEYKFIRTFSDVDKCLRCKETKERSSDEVELSVAVDRRDHRLYFLSLSCHSVYLYAAVALCFWVNRL